MDVETETVDDFNIQFDIVKCSRPSQFLPLFVMHLFFLFAYVMYAFMCVIAVCAHSAVARALSSGVCLLFLLQNTRIMTWTQPKSCTT